MKATLILLVLIPLLSFANADKKEGAISVDPFSSKLKWGPCPPIFPITCETAILHGDPTKPNTDILIRATKGTKFIAHTHTSAERMVLVVGKMEVKYKGQAKIILKKGDYAFGPASHPHEAKCLEDQCILFVAFEAPIDAVIFEGDLN